MHTLITAAQENAEGSPVMWTAFWGGIVLATIGIFRSAYKKKSGLLVFGLVITVASAIGVLYSK